MPAVRERVTLCPEQNGHPTLIFEFPLWWNRSEFFQKYGQRQIDTGNPIYVDYALLLTGYEARAWNKQCSEQFTSDLRSRKPSVLEDMQRWQTILENTRWVIVESYEWESGLS